MRAVAFLFIELRQARITFSNKAQATHSILEQLPTGFATPLPTILWMANIDFAPVGLDGTL